MTLRIRREYPESIEKMVGAGRFERTTPCAQGSYHFRTKTACFQLLMFHEDAASLLRPVDSCWPRRLWAATKSSTVAFRRLTALMSFLERLPIAKPRREDRRIEWNHTGIMHSAPDPQKGATPLLMLVVRVTAPRRVLCELLALPPA